MPLGHDATVIGDVIVGQPPGAQVVVKVTSVSPISNSDYVSLLPPSQVADGVQVTITNMGTQAFTDDLGNDV